ncbi:methylmalonyl Co-A mutase-associated GTPase MeaB [Croceivirga sp. JEA036]|uniref:methylmalonyl Co-A mutase-associated GTPase MeaB n=1 Tax=Croceivirga sp. JEA036 TaxID=2721162 RepID=UPI0014398A6A|nr:methylmalonyl Co-A mutase-associated GTPase MeaB [Croceivirga sp. JEA036]
MGINPSFKNNKQSSENKKKAPIAVDDLFSELKKGNKTALAKAITLIESTHTDHKTLADQLIIQCLQLTNTSIRIGITGVPGVGKSTFIETFGSYLTQQGLKVAVLAVDPTSSISKGSILGDKTRMETLAKDANAFIRPSPASDSLGGVAQRTRESIILCEAAGYDIILIETVGVGQSETAVHSMVDFFLLLKLAGAGDELQGIKRGIMEMADAIVITKADGTNLEQVQLAKKEFKRALHLYPPKPNGWFPKVLSCSALNNTGIDAIWDTVTHFVSTMRDNHQFVANRKKQDKNWFLQAVDGLLKHQFYNTPGIQEQLKTLLTQIETNKISPFAAAKVLIEGKTENT